MTASEAWTCPTCNHTLSTPYCPECGERPLRARDLTFLGLIGQVFHACTSIDGPLILGLRCLVTRPGALTVAYVRGRRKPYALPLQLFLVVNVLFFAMQSLTGVKVFSSTLDSHLHKFFWSPAAQKLITHRLETKRTTLGLYTPVFNQAVALNAKSLIILMAPPFALMVSLLFYRTRFPFVTHAVFSIHFYAFLLLLFCITLVVVGINVLFGGAGLESDTFDHAVSIVDVVACAIYLYIATGTVYGASGASRIIKVLLLTLAVVCIVLGYRFLLLLITLYST